MIREYRWKSIASQNEEAVQLLVKALNIPESIARILVNRGVTDYEKARVFFRPQLTDLCDPFLMEGMDRAAERVIKAASVKEKVFVF